LLWHGSRYSQDRQSKPAAGLLERKEIMRTARSDRMATLFGQVEMAANEDRAEETSTGWAQKKAQTGSPKVANTF
jgi:hypothetical protein